MENVTPITFTLFFFFFMFWCEDSDNLKNNVDHLAGPNWHFEKVLQFFWPVDFSFVVLLLLTDDAGNSEHF